jgi:PAS domain S-box-containing protein
MVVEPRTNDRAAASMMTAGQRADGRSALSALCAAADVAWAEVELSAGVPVVVDCNDRLGWLLGVDPERATGTPCVTLFGGDFARVTADDWWWRACQAMQPPISAPIATPSGPVTVWILAGPGTRDTAILLVLLLPPRALGDGFAAGEAAAPIGADAGAFAKGDAEATSTMAARNDELLVAIEQERDLLQAIIDTIPDHIFVKDRAGRYLRINAAAARDFGFKSPAAALGRSARDVYPSAFLTTIEAEDERVMAGESMVSAVRRGVLTGPDRWWAASKTPLRDATGTVVGSVGISRDVTALKQTEAALAEALAAAEVANARLIEVDAAKSDTMARLSHDFRTPLTSIKGFSDLIALGYVDGDEAREMAAVVAREADRLNRMIGAMLQLDRIEAGRIELAIAPTPLAVAASQALVALRGAWPDRQVTLHASANPTVVLADADALAQIIANVVGNALKYSPGGGPVLVAVDCVGDSNMGRLSVTDRGVGIPADMLEQVFERFTRVVTEDTRAIDGTGLGLPIVRSLARAHGGDAVAEQAPGGGTTVRVTLPLANPLPAGKESATSAPRPQDETGRRQV